MRNTILKSERFFEFFCLLGILIRFQMCFFFFDIDIFQLFPFILGLDDEPLDDLSFCRHELAELDSFIFEDLDEFIDLELRKGRDCIDHSLFLEGRERERVLEKIHERSFVKSCKRMNEKSLKYLFIRSLWARRRWRWDRSLISGRNHWNGRIGSSLCLIVCHNEIFMMTLL